MLIGMSETLAMPDLTLPALAERMSRLLERWPEAPTAAALLELGHVLYAASLLREEGRAVRARVLVAPPEAFDTEGGPPDGIQVLRFAVPHALTANEVKRLSPAAGYYHSALAVWLEPERGFRIWGLLNTGPRWLNLVAGGRKPMSHELPHLLIHVRGPGWVLFYHGYSLVAEWHGHSLRGPRLDVFQSFIFRDRFQDIRRRLIHDTGGVPLPSALTDEVYMELAHLIAMQFVKRVINLVRSSGHGGSLVVMPEGDEGMEATEKWIDCKYAAVQTHSGQRFRRVLQSILRRVGQLAVPGTDVNGAWHIFRQSDDQELDGLEEAFFELARFFADLMQVDGALVVDARLRVLGFGGEIRVDRNVFMVNKARDLNARDVSAWNVLGDGTRHRSVYRLCSVEPRVIGFVISQDSQVRLIANVDDVVTFWVHSVV